MTSIQYLTRDQARQLIRNRVCDDLKALVEELESEGRLPLEDKVEAHELIEKVRRRMAERDG